MDGEEGRPEGRPAAGVQGGQLGDGPVGGEELLPESAQRDVVFPLFAAAAAAKEKKPIQLVQLLQQRLLANVQYLNGEDGGGEDPKVA